MFEIKTFAFYNTPESGVDNSISEFNSYEIRRKYGKRAGYNCTGFSEHLKRMCGYALHLTGRIRFFCWFPQVDRCAMTRQI